jgi:perosamine synthetase
MKTMDQCITALVSVLGKPDNEIPLHAPYFGGNEWKYVKSCLDTGWVSSVGEYVNLFERQLVEYTHANHAIAVVNGTAALHIGLILANVNANDEVLIPSLTFIATANAVAYCGAVPHFIDSHPANLGIDIEKLRDYLKENTFFENNLCINKKTLRKITAIVPVHIFGHPVDMDALIDLCQVYNLTIVEDASESLGSYYKGKHTGSFCDIAVLSFNGNKTVTSGGGGAILLKNTEMAKRAKHLTTTAKKAHRWEFFHDELGYNYRLPNINAALGCAQLEQLPGFIEKKRLLAQRYQDAFQSVDNVTILQESHYAKSNYWLNALILKKPNREFVCSFIELANEHKLGLRGLWTPLDTLPMYIQCPKMDLSQTYALFESVIALPSSPHLGCNYA